MHLVASALGERADRARAIESGQAQLRLRGRRHQPAYRRRAFHLLAKTNIVAVHFKGGGPALIATMSGETEVTFSNITETFPPVNAQRLRGLGVTSLRARVVPAIPPIAEAGLPGYEFVTWHALVAPRAVPAPAFPRAPRES